MGKKGKKNPLGDLLISNDKTPETVVEPDKVADGNDGDESENITQTGDTDDPFQEELVIRPGKAISVKHAILGPGDPALPDMFIGGQETFDFWSERKLFVTRSEYERLVKDAKK